MNFQVFNREQYLFFPWLQSFANTSQAGSPASRMTLTHNTTLPEIYLFCYLWWPWKVEILSGSYLLKFTDKRSRCARHDVEPRFRIPFFFAFFRNSLSPRYHGVASVEKRGWVHGISIFFVKYNHEIRRGEHLLKRQRDAFFKKKKRKKKKRKFHQKFSPCSIIPQCKRQWSSWKKKKKKETSLSEIPISMLKNITSVISSRKS